jgi:glycosyltransferase involved in cell wall biosynthesis
MNEPTNNKQILNRSPIRILHVVGGMNRGGLETWLMHILRIIDSDRFRFDFLVHTDDPCPYDGELRDLGNRIIRCAHTSRPLTYAGKFKQILRQYGNYDIVHSHVHHYSGYVLRLAKQARIPLAIAHSHNDTSAVVTKAGLARRAYYGLTKRWIKNYANLGLACSHTAATDLFGSTWQQDRRWRILYYGIDLKPFYQEVDRQQVRAELEIPEDALIIGHVGRFDPQKNHQFLLEIAAEIAQRQPKMHLLSVGDGTLRPQIEEKIKRLNLSDRVTLLGLRSDVARLMLGAMDLFLLPSLHEGLPLVLLEAQAAGLPCIFSDSITEEVDLVKPSISRKSLATSAATWAETAIAAATTKKLARSSALAILEQSPFNIKMSVKHLSEVYESSFYTSHS